MSVSSATYFQDCTDSGLNRWFLSVLNYSKLTFLDSFFIVWSPWLAALKEWKKQQGGPFKGDFFVGQMQMFAQFKTKENKNTRLQARATWAQEAIQVAL